MHTLSADAAAALNAALAAALTAVAALPTFYAATAVGAADAAGPKTAKSKPPV